MSTRLRKHVIRARRPYRGVTFTTPTLQTDMGQEASPLASENGDKLCSTHSLIQWNCRVTAHGAMGRRIDPSWGGHVDLFLVPASDPRLV